MKKFFLGLLTLIIIVGFVLAAGMGIIKVPYLSSALGGEAKDLGVTIDPQAVEKFSAQNNINIEGPLEEYCISCEVIAFDDVQPIDVTVDSNQLSSVIQKVNNKNGVLKGVQVRLGDNNQGEMAAMLDLTSFGVDYKAPVYTSGGFSMENNRVAITINSGKVGMIPLTDEYIAMGEKYLSNAINSQLENMSGVAIDDVHVSEGQLHYAGDFPRAISEQ